MSDGSVRGMRMLPFLSWVGERRRAGAHCPWRMSNGRRPEGRFGGVGGRRAGVVAPYMGCIGLCVRGGRGALYKGYGKMGVFLAIFAAVVVE